MENKMKICNIFQEVQQNRITHQRCSLSLIQIYNTVPFEEFAKIFLNCISITFTKDINNSCVNSSMRFASLFLSKLIERDNGSHDVGDEEPSHPLLKRAILNTLKYHKQEDFKQRYHACNFISILLGTIGDDYNLDNDLCDAIQNAMLERIKDTKSLIREIATETLQRLQDPSNNECPVIGAYANCFNDPIPLVRAKVVKICAPCNQLLPKIVESVYDESASVRLQAFQRLAHMRPTWLKIVDRQTIILKGFEEKDKRVSKMFREVLLPKWLHSYEGNYLKVLRAVSLDADEKDMETTDLTCYQMMEVFLKSHPINNFLNYLPLEENRLVPHNKLQYELVLFWNILFSALNKREGMEELVETLVPELVSFCKYIEEFICKKNKVEMERWQFLEYQYILLKLLDMILAFDVSDEVGRQALHQMATDILSKRIIERPVINKLLCILEKLAPCTNSFIDEVIEINRSILVPVVEIQPSKQDMQEFNYKLAELDVRINIVNEEVEEAVAVRDLALAAQKQGEFKALTAQKELLLVNQPQVRRKKVSDVNENQMTHKTFNVLNCLLEMKNVNRMTPTLLSFGNDMIGEMKDFKDIEHQRLAFKSCCLYALLDKQWALKYLTLIYRPIMLHRTMQTQLDIPLLQSSLMAVGDLLYIHGSAIFKTSENDETSDRTISKRRLYNPGNEDNMDPDNLEETSIQHLIDTIVSMLNTEVSEIKETASWVLSRMVTHGLYVSSGLFTRVFVEWCNPVNVQTSPALQMLFGYAMFNFSQNIPNSQTIIESSVIPSLYVIGNAPKTSPLADTHIDNVIDYLCKITLPLNGNGVSNTHKNLAYLLCNALDKQLENKCAIIWSKMLTVLEPPINDMIAMKELKGQVEGFLEDVVNKVVKARLRKYLTILTNGIDRVSQSAIEESTEVDESTKNDTNVDNSAADSEKRSLSSESESEEGQKNPKKKPRLSEQQTDHDKEGGDNEKSSLSQPENNDEANNSRNDEENKSSRDSSSQNVVVKGLNKTIPQENVDVNNSTTMSSLESGKTKNSDESNSSEIDEVENSSKRLLDSNSSSEGEKETTKRPKKKMRLRSNEGKEVESTIPVKKRNRKSSIKVSELNVRKEKVVNGVDCGGAAEKPLKLKKVAVILQDVVVKEKRRKKSSIKNNDKMLAVESPSEERVSRQRTRTDTSSNKKMNNNTPEDKNNSSTKQRNTRRERRLSPADEKTKQNKKKLGKSHDNSQTQMNVNIRRSLRAQSSEESRQKNSESEKDLSSSKENNTGTKKKNGKSENNLLPVAKNNRNKTNQPEKHTDAPEKQRKINQNKPEKHTDAPEKQRKTNQNKPEKHLNIPEKETDVSIRIESPGQNQQNSSNNRRKLRSDSLSDQTSPSKPITKKQQSEAKKIADDCKVKKGEEDNKSNRNNRNLIDNANRKKGNKENDRNKMNARKEMEDKKEKNETNDKNGGSKGIDKNGKREHKKNDNNERKENNNSKSNDQKNNVKKGNDSKINLRTPSKHTNNETKNAQNVNNGNLTAKKIREMRREFKEKHNMSATKEKTDLPNTRSTRSNSESIDRRNIKNNLRGRSDDVAISKTKNPVETNGSNRKEVNGLPMKGQNKRKEVNGTLSKGRSSKRMKFNKNKK